MITAPDNLLITWRDVQQRLTDAPSPFESEVDHFSLRIYAPDEPGVSASLAGTFGATYNPEIPAIELLSVGDERRQLPIEYFAPEDAPDWHRIDRPLWSTPHIEQDVPERTEDAPVIAAFFSFKGGVGRTMSSYATLLKLLDRPEPAKVLYIDADVQAPGITWLLPPEDRLSWLDALALVQDADDWETEALPLIADRVKLSRIEMELTSGRRSFYVLPAVRGMAQLEHPPVTPEQLVRRRGRAWVIGDLLTALAETLSLDAILVDLRAGITELSSPVMLDPRVRSLLVTTCAEQSVQGTERAFQLVGTRATWAPELDVIITKVPRDGNHRFEDVEARMISAWTHAQMPESSDPPTIHRVDFADALLAFDDLRAVAKALRYTPLDAVAESLANALHPTLAPTQPPPTTVNIVASLAASLEFAEGHAQLRLLPSPPLRELARQPKGRLPADVILGAKGAGKTFAWGQLVIAQTWARFCEAVQVDADAEAEVFPLLMPRHLEPAMHEKARTAEAAIRPGDRARLTGLELANRLKAATTTGGTPLDFWTQAIDDRLGLPPEAGASPRALEAELAKDDRHIILVVDGIEDALQTGPDNPMTPDQATLLRALLMDLVIHLNDLGPRRLGLIVFIRRDLAAIAIPQNFGQFEARHRAVALNWSAPDALRLTLWLLKEAQWTSDLPLESAPYSQLAQALHPFWGEKMGGKKDAYTDRWVIAALSDLNGRFQARDLVRFVANAAGAADTLPLAPALLRSAVQDCSRDKIKELEIEFEGLQPIFDKLRAIHQDERKIPIQRDALPLTTSEVDFLIDQGIFYFDEREDRYYMPEISRHGLKFGLYRGGRARVLSLFRNATRGQQ